MQLTKYSFDRPIHITQRVFSGTQKDKFKCVLQRITRVVVCMGQSWLCGGIYLSARTELVIMLLTFYAVLGTYLRKPS